MRLLTPWFVGQWRDRMLNVHPALLPSYRGLHTHERALADGVKIHGATVHFVAPEMDAGPIIVQAAVPVLQDDTPDALAARVLAQEHRIYPLALKLVAERGGEGRWRARADQKRRARAAKPCCGQPADRNHFSENLFGGLTPWRDGVTLAAARRRHDHPLHVRPFFRPARRQPLRDQGHAAAEDGGLDYKARPAAPFKAPKGKLPYIDDDGEKVADSTFIRFHIEKKYGFDFDAGLTPEQKATGWALEKLCEDHLYWLALAERWMDEGNFAKGPARFFDSAPAPLRPIPAR